MNTDQKSIMQFLAAQTEPVMADAFLSKWPSGPDSGYHALATLRQRGFVQLAPGRPGHRGWELTPEGRNYRETQMADATAKVGERQAPAAVAAALRAGVVR